jgi:hypothetical protein
MRQLLAQNTCAIICAENSYKLFWQLPQITKLTMNQQQQQQQQQQ